MTRVDDLKRLHIEPDKIPRVSYTNLAQAKSRPEDRSVQRVMLISPAATLYKGDLPRCTYHLGLGYIAAVLEQNGYDVTILDCFVESYYQFRPVGDDPNFFTYGIDQTETARRIATFGPDLVGVSSIFSNQSDAVAEMFAAIRLAAPNAFMAIVGSVHLSECLHQGFLAKNTPLYRMSYKQGIIDVPDLWRGVEVAALAVQFDRTFNQTNQSRKSIRAWSATQY